jgi:hypothetical protein
MNWLAHLFSRNRCYDDLAVSIQEHLDERTDELMEDGMSCEDAAQKPHRIGPMRATRAESIRMALR